MVGLGFGIYGQSRVTPDISPRFDTDTRWRIARMVYEPDALADLERADEAEFVAATDAAWHALAWSWQVKFGMPLENRYGREIIDADLVRRTLHRTAGAQFADTPPNVCWMLTEFELAKIDGHFLKEWAETGEPRIILNHRDPRDVLLSQVNFLSGYTKKGYGHFSNFKVVNQILNGFDTLEEKLSYALTDPSFPGQDSYEKVLWLKNHPNVCTVTFEELIGVKGGGSEGAQVAAVERVLDFLGMPNNGAELADQLYNKDAFSFFRGQIGAWKDHFTTELEARFDAKYGHLLPLYGYR